MSVLQSEQDLSVDEICAQLPEIYPYLQEADYRCLTSIEEVKEYLSHLEPGQLLCLDYETTGLNPYTNKIVGVALSYAERQAVYIPVAHTEAPEMNVPWEELRLVLTETFVDRPMLVFNYIFEKNWSVVHGLDFDTYFDCMPATYIYDINLRRSGLKYKSEVLLRIKQIEFKDVVTPQQLKDGITFADVHPDIATLYAAGDADLTLRLWNLTADAREEQKLIWNMDNLLMEVIRCMENNHMKVDVPKLKLFKKQLIDHRERLMRRIFKLVGHEFDINSPKQVGRVLFEELGIPPPKMNKTGYATDVKTLELVEDQHPVATEIGYFRRTNKQLSTYVENFLRGLSPNGEARFGLQTCRAVTGRLAAGGSDSAASSPTYEETGYTEINAQAITAGGKIKKNKAMWLIKEFTSEFLSACEAEYLQERLQRHFKEWVEYESSRKIKEEYTTEKWKEWKKGKSEEELEAWIDDHGVKEKVESTKSKKLTVTSWRKGLANVWRDTQAKQEWRDTFFDSQKMKILQEYQNSEGKAGCVYANPVGWGYKRACEFTCPREVCECIEEGKAKGFELTEETQDTVDRKELPGIREVLIARDGYTYAAIDYSGVEYRVAGNMSQEPLWIDEFLNSKNPDPHSATAEGIYQKPRSEITKPERDTGKTVNFTILFGGGGGTIARNIGNGMTYEDGVDIQNRFFRGAPKLHKFIEDTHREIKRVGFIKTRFGRKRYFPDAALDPWERGINKDEKRKRGNLIAKAERDAFSTKIQGTAADIMRFSLVKLHRKIKAMGWEEDVRMLLTVHDEVVFEIRTEMLDRVIPVLVECMTKHRLDDWKIPLTCDIEIGPNWDETVEYKLIDGVLVPSDEYKKMLVEEEGQPEAEPQVEEKPKTDIALLLSFDYTIDNLKKFREAVRERPGPLHLRIMFEGHNEEIEMDETVSEEGLVERLGEEGLKVLVR